MQRCMDMYKYVTEAARGLHRLILVLNNVFVGYDESSNQHEANAEPFSRARA